MKLILMNRLLITTIILTVGSPHLIEAEEAIIQANQKEKTLYKINKGETLRDVALQFLGGEEYMAELLEYNKISNPLVVDEGFMLMIPGGERERAIQGLIKTRDILAKAIEAMAEEYAADEFTLAQEAIEAAEENRRIGAYEKAIALGQLGFARAEHAIIMANKRANVQRSGKITAIDGKVDISHSSEKSWETASVGQELTIDAIIRTGPDSRAKLILDDGSIIQVLESSKFVLRKFFYDLRTGKRTSQLEVILGNILGKIKPKKVENSTFEVTFGSGALSIRGTALRVGKDPAETSRISVLEGKIAVNANDEETAIPEDFGTFVEEDKPPAEPIELLPPPKGLSPGIGIYETSAQNVILSWDRVAINPKKITQRVTNYLFNKFARYHLEVATDAEFNFIVKDEVAKENQIQTGVLPPGEYYWRVSSVDNNGLEGPYSDVGKLRIVRDLTIRIIPEFSPIERNGSWIIHPTDLLKVIPSQIESSVNYLEYSLNHGPFQVFDGIVNIPEDGEYLLKVRGIGLDEYAGNIVQQLIEVDGTPPEISIDVSGIHEDPNIGKMVYVTVKATDYTGVESLEYKLNDDEYRSYTEKIPINITRKPGGVYLKGADLHGNTVVHKNLRRSLKVSIHCRATDLLGNESFEGISLKY